MVYSALTIAGSDSGGGAGVQADLKTFAALGVHGLSVITALTAQNTVAVEEVYKIPASFIKAQFKAVHGDFDVGAAKTGMLASAEIIRSVSRSVGDYLLVVDPVMVSESGGRLLDEDALDALKDVLLPKAALVTPNIFEAEILAGLKINGMEDVREACRRISEFGCSVVVKGGHLDAVDLLYDRGDFHSFPGVKLEGSFHGSGCTFSASITAYLAMGFDLLRAVGNSKKFVSMSLAAAYKPGCGELGVVNQRRRMLEDDLDSLQRDVKTGVLELESLEGLSRLVPEVGMNLCYARADAKDLGDVVGIRGRMVRIGESVRGFGGVAYGVSRHMGRVVLAAHRFDKNTRAALNIKYRAEVIDAIRGLERFTMASFDRADEPGDSSTMEWGTKVAVEGLGRVPDIIYDTGGVGKEPMIRILGRDPSEVLVKLKRILEALNGL